MVTGCPLHPERGPGAKAEMYFPFTPGTFHTEESSAQELLAAEPLGEGAAQAVRPAPADRASIRPCGHQAPPPPLPQPWFPKSFELSG